MEQNQIIEESNNVANVDEKKEYCGCLSFLLPMSILGCILTIIYDIAIGVENLSYGATFLAPTLLIIQNVIVLVSVFKLLSFKKIGLYIFIGAQIFSICIALMFPDEVDHHSIARAIFATGLLIILLYVKKNGKTGFEQLS